MWRQSNISHLLTLALLAQTAGACLRPRPAGQPASSQSAAGEPSLSAAVTPSPAAVPSPTPAPVLRDGGHYFKDAVNFGGGLRFGDRMIKERNEKYKYDIDFTYPQLEGAGDAWVAKFNRVVAAVVQGNVKDFRVWPRGAEDDRKRTQHWIDAFDSLYGRYDVAYATDELVSIRFDTYTYGWGAAHSVQHFRVVNYDLAAGRHLKLSDLFRPGSRHLRFVADFCVNELRRQSKADCVRYGAGRECEEQGDFWLPEYVTPTPDNYQNWNLTRAGLLMSFDACRVASCSVGEREVLIRYTELKNLIPGGIIERLSDGRDT